MARAFISYRSGEWSQLEASATRLIERGICSDVRFIPPDRIALRSEMLLVYDYFETLAYLSRVITDCDVFAFVDSDRQWQSYWTRQELRQWRRFTKDHTFYGVRDGEIQAYTAKPMPVSEKKLLAKISVGTDPMFTNQHGPGAAWGKFAKNCFLATCGACGNHLLISQKATEDALAGKSQLRCQWCSMPLRFRQLAERGNFYRDRIVLELPPEPAEAVPLEDRDLEQLLLVSELPPKFRLITREGERLWSDLQKVGLGYLGLAAAGLLVFGAMAVADKIFGDDAEKPKS